MNDPQPNRPQLVVLDMAGTTVLDRDYVHASFMRSLAQAGGIAITRDEANDWMGYPKPLAISELVRLKTGTPPPPELVQRIHDAFVADMVHFYETDPEFGEVPGAQATFERLRGAGIRVGLDTGFSRPIAQAILRRLGWLQPGVLDATITSDEAPRGRPHPDMVLALMQRLGVALPSQVAKVGDTPSDLQQGTAAGCGWVVGVLSGSHTRHQLLPHPHTHLVDSVTALPALFGL